MTPLVAQLRTDRDDAEQRIFARRTLNLKVGSQYLDGDALVLIYNLSRNGLLIQTLAPLELDDTIEVELPEAGTIWARVVRSDGDHYGCRFLTPISNGAVSAALLRSPAVSDPHALPILQSAAVQASLREEMWTELVGQEITPIERVLLYAFLLLATIAVGLFVYALLAFAVIA